MIKENVKKYMSDSGVAVTVFTKKVGISPTTYYRWMNGELKISDKKLNSIADYIKKFGY